METFSSFSSFPSRRRRRKIQSQVWRIKLLNRLFSFAFLALLAFFPFSFFLFFWYSRDLPRPDKVKRKEGFSIVILDRKEKPIYDIFTDQNRIPVGLSDIPDYLKKATIAIEDKDFYKHQGFDPKGILRALWHILTFRGLQGGSTLTQQLVKNVLLSSERTLPRKIKEFILALEIERRYKKEEILQMYLNEAPYGGTMWGIEAAAQGYFGKTTKDLTLLESAILAGLPQRPSFYSPFGANPRAYIARTEEVLRRMREEGFISQFQEYELKKELPKVKFASSSGQFFAPHFVFFVKNELIKRFGEKMVESGGLKVITTLESELQKKAEKIVKEEVEKLAKLKVGNGAALVLNPKSGEILAYVGSKEYEASDNPDFPGKFDVVSLGFRQPGSALKPITYAVAFAKGYTPATLLMDVETHFPGGEGKPDYVPQNYDGKFRGPVQIRFALGNSINVPAVKMTALVGVAEVLKTAYALGLETLAPSTENVQKLGLSLTLGGGEVRLLDLTAAFGVFANSGIRNDPVAILKVVSPSGQVLYEHRPIPGKKVLSPEVSFLISDILSDNQARKEVFGERSALVIPGKKVAVKTGTTDDKRDNWAIGYTPSVVVGVWVGNNDNSPMDARLTSGLTGAAPIWNRIIQEALKDKTDEPFFKPENIISQTIDAYGGGLPYEGRETRSEYFIKGTEPTAVSPIYQKLKLSKTDKQKLANAVEIASGAYEEKLFLVFQEKDPTSKDNRNRWQEGIDSWIEQQTDPIFHPPKEVSKADENTVWVQIKKPADLSRVEEEEVNVLAEAKAVSGIKKMELYVNETLKKSQEEGYLDETLKLLPGRYLLKIKAYDAENRLGEAEVRIGVKESPFEPTPTSSTIPALTGDFSFTPSPSP